MLPESESVLPERSGGAEADGTGDPNVVSCPNIRFRMRLMQCNISYMCPTCILYACSTSCRITLASNIMQSNTTKRPEMQSHGAAAEHVLRAPVDEAAHVRKWRK